MDNRMNQMLDSLWIRPEYFAARNRVEMSWTKYRKLILTTTFPHLFTPYPHAARERKYLTKDHETTTLFTLDL